MATILIVDDEAAVRAIARRVLERAGYGVIEAESAAAALDLAERADDVALVLSDFSLPGMTGAELGRAVRRSHPDLPILYMSGYGMEEIEEKVGDLEPTRFLAKPFTPASLVEAVRGALER